MLKDITVVDYQGREKRAQANCSNENTGIAFQKKRLQSLKIEYILIKGKLFTLR